MPLGRDASVSRDLKLFPESPVQFSEQELGDAIAVIAHELSEPLTAIASYVTACERGLEPGWPDRARIRQGLAESLAGIFLANINELHDGRLPGTWRRNEEKLFDFKDQAKGHPS
jgi:hypothetical protein